MKNIVRLKSISIKNIKNVENGKIDIIKTITDDGSIVEGNILGIYGQNGSGKTALVEALKILKTVISGDSLGVNTFDLISSGSKSAIFEFEFYIFIENILNVVRYQFVLEKIELENNHMIKITNEELYYDILPKTKGSKFKTLIKFRGIEDISPALLRNFLRKDEESRIELRLLENNVDIERKSIIFSKKLRKKLLENKSFDKTVEIIDVLFNYGERNLTVVDNRELGSINANILIPLAFKCKDGNKTNSGKIVLYLNKPHELLEEEFNVVGSIITQMNIVLTKIIPNLNVSIKKLGNEFNIHGKTMIKFQLFSKQGDKEIPLKYESDGIKKIISILSTLTVVYNDPTYCLVVDELDAGIFEYLLGEILEIISKFGKGQLIFTSHNLRPLEVLNKENIILTTTDRSNNYTKLTNIKSTNNMRNVYMRNVMLGVEKGECLYKETDSYEIRKAFRKAGRGLNG